jgi:multiple sugar transport system ATP-binding protein
MNFVPGQFVNGLLRTAIGDLAVSDALRRRVKPPPRGNGQVVVGIRPEHLEDAALIGDTSRGHTFKVKVDVLESLGSERYVHFTVRGDRAAAQLELAQETAAAEFGRSRSGVPVVARVGASSRIRQGQEAQLWVDTTQLYLFDPESGRNLVASESEATAASAPS